MSIHLPQLFIDWFTSKNWQPRDYQLAMVEAFRAKRSTLLIAPTGGGKTLAGFLPSLVDLSSVRNDDYKGLHTLYISPLKALTNDIERNLMQPIHEMGLPITVESRTGDTPSHKRQRQRRKPPNILLTTPESLMLMLSYTDAPKVFGSLKAVIVDEVHSLAPNKRGDLAALGLARLERLAPGYVRFGLSATVAEPQHYAVWLGKAGKPAQLLQPNLPMQPEVKLLHSDARMPYSGYMAQYAMPEIYFAIQGAQTTLIFVNTRAQAELVFQSLWEMNRDALPIALYHGSLSKEQRRKTEAMMAAGKLRAIVSTSALELGIDWGEVDLVIQIGAPKGVSRLLQRIGRSNHHLDKPSRALLVPGNRFEALECEAAIRAIQAGRRDGETLLPGAAEILPQYIMNCACSEPIRPDEVYDEIRCAAPYSDLSRDVFDALFRFTIDGGYALRAYERYQRLIPQSSLPESSPQDSKAIQLDSPRIGNADSGNDGFFVPTSRSLIQRHRQNIGVIVEAGRLKVKKLYKAHRGRILGEVEEYFAQGLTPGDTFLFAGEVLAFAGVTDMTLEAWPAKSKEAKIPSYQGGQMPLSTFLADGVRELLSEYVIPNEPQRSEESQEIPPRPKARVWDDDLPKDVIEWLELQQHYSCIPPPDRLLVEHFPYRKLRYTLFYTFEGRKANQTLGMLLTRRMERMGLKPISFSITDYGLSIASLEALNEEHLNALIMPDILGDELEEWILDSPMLKRSFRKVATIGGLTEQRSGGARKTMKQVTFSTDLIYDVLRRHEPEHILLDVTRQDAERELLDLARLSHLLTRFEGKVRFKSLSRVSPMAIPIVLAVRSEPVHGSGTEALLDSASLQHEAERMMQEIRDDMSGTA